MQPLLAAVLSVHLPTWSHLGWMGCRTFSCCDGSPTPLLLFEAINYYTPGREMDLFNCQQCCPPSTCLPSCSQQPGVCVHHSTHIKRLKLFKLLWKHRRCFSGHSHRGYRVVLPCAPWEMLSEAQRWKDKLTSQGVMASWKNPNKKKKAHLWSSRRAEWKQPMGLPLQCVLPHSVAHGRSYANWEQLLCCFCSELKQQFRFQMVSSLLDLFIFPVPLLGYAHGK